MQSEYPFFLRPRSHDARTGAGACSQPSIYTRFQPVTFRHAIFRHDLAYVKNVSSTDFFSAEVDFWPRKLCFFDLIISQEVSRSHFL